MIVYNIYVINVFSNSLWFLAFLDISMGQLQQIFGSLVFKKRNLFLQLLFCLVLLWLVKFLVLKIFLLAINVKTNVMQNYLCLRTLETNMAWLQLAA